MPTGPTTSTIAPSTATLRKSCLRCGHIWLPRMADPVQDRCPQCRSRQWNSTPKPPPGLVLTAGSGLVHCRLVLEVYQPGQGGPPGQPEPGEMPVGTVESGASSGRYVKYGRSGGGIVRFRVKGPRELKVVMGKVREVVMGEVEVDANG